MYILANNVRVARSDRPTFGSAVRTMISSQDASDEIISKARKKLTRVNGWGECLCST